MQHHSPSHHIERVISATQKEGSSGRGEALEADIARSWKRCVDRFSLDPAQPHEALVIDHYHLLEHQERLCKVLEIARFEMNSLYQHISGSGYAILLADGEGVILHSVSDPNLIQQFTCAGLWTGANWNEQHEGTNAIGTCLMERHPLMVHRDEHFLNSNMNLTCSAAPIFDPHGRLLAVLDTSSVSFRDSKQSQFHTMALVTLSAKLIENCNFLQQFRGEWMLRFHSRPELVGMLSEGMLAFDGAGCILAVNQSALNQLDAHSRELLLGHPVSEIFDVSLDVLMGRAGRHSYIVWPVRDLCGHDYFAMLRSPERHPAASMSHIRTKPAGLAKNTLGMTLQGLAGDDSVMTHNVRCSQRVMNRDVSILLYGETGTGKEAFAKAVHAASSRANKPFVAVNCASIPESLIESELFGYKHGAFTGARREGMRGKVLQASGGTLFLDEIGDMPAHLQTRLLRVLEEKEVLPLGSETPIPVDLHIISATHRDLRERIASGEFREDLYYRLNGLALALPPLRERSDRIALIEYVLVIESGGQKVQVDENAFAVLTAYDWPGNLRQLHNVLRTAAALCEGGVIRLEDLPPEIVRTPHKAPVKCAHAALAPVPAENSSALQCAEKEALLQELNRHHWNITNTAARLEISRNTLYRKMKKHGITPSTQN